MNLKGSLPIGVFDSGIGGLNVLKEMFKLLPTEDFIYLADFKNCPYGVKSKEEIIFLIKKIIAFFKKMSTKIIVFACNTSSVYLENIQNEDLPLLGVIMPTFNEAIQVANNSLALLATNATINSGVYQELFSESFLKDKDLYFVGCSEFVLAIEAGELETKKAYDLVFKKIAFLQDKDIDTLVLACTHFDFYQEIIESILPDVKIVTSGKKVAQELYSFLDSRYLLNKQQVGKRIFLTTGSRLDFQRKLELFFNSKYYVHEVQLE